MFKVGDQVCHKYYPEEYGLGIVKDNDGNGFVLVAWENEFGEYDIFILSNIKRGKINEKS